MKKILSLILVVITLLSTLALTSCDAAMEMFIDYMNAQNTNQSTTPPDEIRHTITKEEWIAFADAKNFTAYNKYESSIVYCTEYAVKLVDMNDPDKSVDPCTFFILKNNTCYTLFQSSGEWWASEYNSVLDQFNSLTLESHLDSGMFTEEFYDSLVFNEETNTYEMASVEIYFEYGILVYFKIEGNLIFGDVGSTVIEIPENYMPWTGIK